MLEIKLLVPAEHIRQGKLVIVIIVIIEIGIGIGIGIVN